MKKWLLLLLIAIIIVAGVAFVMHPKAEDEQTGIEKVSDLVPGVYRAEFAQPDQGGWTPFVVIEINELGEIAEVTFDYSSPDGRLKTQDQEYNERMKAVSGIGPSQYCPRFAKNLIIYQDPDKVDSVTGATSSSIHFKELAKAALADAKEGKQETVYVETNIQEQNPEQADAVSSATASANSKEAVAGEVAQ